MRSVEIRVPGSELHSDDLAFGGDLSMTMLSRLLLSPDPVKDAGIAGITRAEFDDMAALAQENHVIVRALETFRRLMNQAGDAERGEWATAAIEREQARIENAISFLERICGSLSEANCQAIVIKSLDHWPDLGSDLDLYTDAEPANVIRVMCEKFNASLAERSWGDRMAHKWNFIIPGLPESVEIHMGRLGQTGEQLSVASALSDRSRTIQIGGRCFSVTAVEDRLMICTLQRMYRHFYARLCDIVDTAELVETKGVDYEDLLYSAQEAGIWEGIATFLVIASDYVKHFRGKGINLPPLVKAAARFRGDQVHFGKGFLRIPILPHSAKLYASQLTSLMTKGELKSAARLSVLPCLAAAAALQYKVTGSDKGIW